MAKLANKNTKGFTLLEVLVVLILFSLISMLLMQGFSQILQLRFRFMDQLKQQQLTILQRYWVSSLISGMMPDRLKGSYIFNADNKHIQGLSIGALHAETGAPLPIELYLEPVTNTQVALRYKLTNNSDWTLAVWPQKKIVFSYLGRDGQWYDTWPPKTQQPSDQIPVAIRIWNGASDTKIINWYIAINGRTQPRIDVRDSDLFQ